MHNREPLVEVKNLKKYFSANKEMFLKKATRVVKAVDDVSFTVYKGETLGLIGESGCGKSTLLRVILGLVAATSGEIYYKGSIIDKTRLKNFRKESQMIFQDPYSSLDPRMSIQRIIEEPLRIHTKLDRKEKTNLVVSLLKKTGLAEDDLKKYPHEFSGGQRQRIGIARALVMNPEFIVCDEPVSALDMSIQAQILNLFKNMQKEFNLTYLFVSHDMSVVKHVSDRIAVMYLGRIVELATKHTLFDNTLHPYSVALMSAIPIPDPTVKKKRILLEGDIPSPIDTPPGCSFHTRCLQALPICRQQTPPLKELAGNHFVACHLFGSGG